uniref:Uncharacterized protein n=1 Tax=Arundo donax TaxID=35708 RepID=A0A0A9AAY4_ARUDO
MSCEVTRVGYRLCSSLMANFVHGSLDRCKLNSSADNARQHV